MGELSYQPGFATACSAARYGLERVIVDLQLRDCALAFVGGSL
ncbi:hypothetical protein [Actinacidiphila oryziradicis]|nr:hypothetical protein [Actinacidiphila oryziradicis]